jgi:hypothetical protein
MRLPDALVAACLLPQFGDIVSFQALEATGFSAGNGLGMGVSPIANCLDKVLPARAACAGRVPGRSKLRAFWWPRDASRPSLAHGIFLCAVQAHRRWQGCLRRRQRHG